jgi:hypothetical protein
MISITCHPRATGVCVIVSPANPGNENKPNSEGVVQRWNELS